MEDRLTSLLEQLQDSNPKVRKGACEGLAKLGDPAAIPHLSKIYANDADKKVKESAAQTLRFFAAQQHKARQKSILPLLAGFLTLTLLGLLAANVLLRLGGGEGKAEAVATSIPQGTARPRSLLLSGLSEVFVPALASVDALQAEWSAGAGKLPCTAKITPPTLLSLNQTEMQVYATGDVLALHRGLGLSVTRIQEIYLLWEGACATPDKGTPEQVQTAMATLDSVETDLLTLADSLFMAQSTPDPTITPTPTATLTPTITPTPEPTVDPIVLQQLVRLVNNTKSSLNALVDSRWLIVQAGGTSAFGCGVDRIESDYTGAPEALLVREPDLTQTIQLINESLALARQTTEAYQSACRTNSYTPELIAQGIQDAQIALANLDIALEILSSYR